MVNIFKVPQNILFVCPTINFGTRERMLLRDCLLLRSIGHSIFVYTIKDSFLDLECRKHGLNIIHHQGHHKTSFFKWYKLGKLREFIKSAEVNIIHCYDLNFLWPVSFFLRNKPLTALFFTLTGEIKNFYNQFWYRPLISRIDLVFIPVREMIESVIFNLDIPQRKINFSGLGLKKIDQNNVYPKMEFDSNVWNFACWINDHEECEKEIATCFEAIWSVNTSYQLKKLAHLHLYSTRKWDSNVITKKIKALVEKYKVQNYVHFHEHKNINDIEADIWISYNTKTPLEDYTIVSMLKEIPTIMARNATTSEICRVYGHKYQTYKANDSRELRSMMKFLTSKLASREPMPSPNSDELWLEHGEEGYKYNLFRNYEKHLNKRLRFYS